MSLNTWLNRKLKREIAVLAEKSMTTGSELKTNEEATKQVLIVPMLKLLGYDIHNIDQVKCEYGVNSNNKGQKIDYALITKRNNTILVECKAMGISLNRFWGQLARYFSYCKDTRFAILTNGIEYRIYTDTISRGALDADPIITINIRRAQNNELTALRGFSRKGFREKKLLKIIRKNKGSLIKERNESSYREAATTVDKVKTEKQCVEIGKLGRIKFNEDLNMDIFIPNRSEYSKLIVKSDNNLLRGNPDSRYFIGAFLVDKKYKRSIKGYVVGEFVGNKNSEVETYLINYSEIYKFLMRNKEAIEQGFINVKLVNRMDGSELGSYFRSSIPVSVFNIDGMVQQFPF